MKIKRDEKFFIQMLELIEIDKRLTIEQMYRMRNNYLKLAGEIKNRIENMEKIRKTVVKNINLFEKELKETEKLLKAIEFYIKDEIKVHIKDKLGLRYYANAATDAKGLRNEMKRILNMMETFENNYAKEVNAYPCFEYINWLDDDIKIKREKNLFDFKETV